MADVDLLGSGLGNVNLLVPFGNALANAKIEVTIEATPATDITLDQLEEKMAELGNTVTGRDDARNVLILKVKPRG